MATLARLAESDAPDLRAYVTEAEYVAMCDAGVFGDDHVELNRGVLERMPPSGLEHGVYLGQLAADLTNAYDRASHRVVIDVYSRLERDLLRAPDLAVVLLPITGKLLPVANVLLAVEIADTSRGFDLTRKAADYARAGIPHYWVVDVTQRETHVMGAPVDGAYTRVGQVPFAAPLGLPGSERTVTLGD